MFPKAKPYVTTLYMLVKMFIKKIHKSYFFLNEYVKILKFSNILLKKIKFSVIYIMLKW
jgi:hypothetical protein